MNKMTAIACISFIFVMIGCTSSDSEESKEDAGEVISDPVDSFKQFAEQFVKATQRTFKTQRFILAEGNPRAKSINEIQRIDGQLAALRGEVHITDFAIYVRSLVHIEISSDYTIDVKESKSLIVPFRGTITMKKRIVRDRLIEFVPKSQSHKNPIKDKFLKALKANPDRWETVSIDFGFQNGQWNDSTNMAQKLQGNLKPAK